MGQKREAVGMICMPVEEVRANLDSLSIVQSRSNLVGSQRQTLEEVVDDLEYAIAASTDGIALVPVHVVLRVLRCFWDAQDWTENL